MFVIETTNQKETLTVGEQLGKKAERGTVICVDGDLGVGKTVLAQGIAKGLGVNEPVVSPTFTIVQEYHDGRIPFYHFDVYRIEDPDEMYEIGFEEYFYGDGVCMVEWSELIAELLPPESIHITIRKDLKQGPDHRMITIEGIEKSWLSDNHE
ncbi:MAG: tRNA (adenosine(37)-N6)-threonylcarbamoyltransferase complex ATPase subunit type 1 TsaE [Lachnospiraceae bacterium]|nr:tRNA (adenosine(37)-N6)-threonylcarbamoyltransferase complex ATPase subunit type 1 TsaE [Lachnospiraceae bacterium]